jgi:nitroreductase
MSFLTLAKNRYSCRDYKNQQIEEDKLNQVLEAGRIAPSAKNLQPWRFIVVQEKNLLEKIKGCYGRTWIQSAPTVLVICGDHKTAWYRADGKDHTNVDISIAIDHITLAATDQGLATCWICKFNAMQVGEILQLPEGVEPIALIPIGYPNDSTDPGRHDTKRKPINEIAHWYK